MRQGRYTVRPMTLADAESVTDVHLAVWRQVYASAMPADYLAELSRADWLRFWQAALSTDAPRDITHLVGLDETGAIVGFGSAGPSRDVPAVTAWELFAINVLEVAHGTGLADRLLDGLIRNRPCSLWVLSGNDRAAAFYRRHGFVADGAIKPHEPSGASEQRLVRTAG